MYKLIFVDLDGTLLDSKKQISEYNCEVIKGLQSKAKIVLSSARGFYRIKKYNVFMDVEHPRKSKCDCPHAKDKRIICKHRVALYFTAFPDEVNKFLKEVEEADKEYEAYEEELYNKTIKYINSMSKKELKEALIETLNVAPEWVYDRFVRDRVGY